MCARELDSFPSPEVFSLIPVAQYPNGQTHWNALTLSYFPLKTGNTWCQAPMY